MHGASPGRIDRKVEIPLPNESARMDIIKIHSRKIAKKGEIGGLAVRQAVAVTERISITAGALISSRDVEDYDWLLDRKLYVNNYTRTHTQRV